MIYNYRNKAGLKIVEIKINRQAIQAMQNIIYNTEGDVEILFERWELDSMKKSYTTLIKENLKLKDENIDLKNQIKGYKSGGRK